MTKPRKIQKPFKSVPEPEPKDLELVLDALEKMVWSKTDGEQSVVLTDLQAQKMSLASLRSLINRMGRRYESQRAHPSQLQSLSILIQKILAHGMPLDKFHRQRASFSETTAMELELDRLLDLLAKVDVRLKNQDAINNCICAPQKNL